MLGKNVVWTRSSLHAGLASADHHFAVRQHFRELIESNQAGSRLAQFSVLCGANTIPTSRKTLSPSK
eukprot:4634312-Pyramimonas_sp.AAC.1